MSTPDRHLRGQGTFTADLRAPGDLHLAVLRAPLAHGRIDALDTAAAEAMPGVRLVLTADRLTGAGVRDLTGRAMPAGIETPVIQPARPVLARDRVVYTGEPVAAVIAETRAAAEDALEAIVLDIAPLPVASGTAGRMPGIWPDAPGNRAFAWSVGNTDETAGLIAGAAHVVETRMVHPRIAISPIEPRAAIAAHEAGRYTLSTPSQGVVGLRTALAGTLGIEPGALRVVTPDVGGSFAVKIWPYPEHVLCLVAARLTGARVGWDGTRSEAFVADAAGRGRCDHGQLALDADGRFLAFRIDAVADMGAYLGTAAASVVTSGAVRPFSQGYVIPGQAYRVEAVFTNAVPTDAYRGAGKPESAAVLERLIDLAAARLGLCRLALRRRNLLAPEALPHATPMGERIDAGDFPALADALARRGDWAGLAARKAEARVRGQLRGAGIGFHMHATGGSTAEQSTLRALPDGSIALTTGSQDGGQGHARALARIVAGTLDIDESRISVMQGDSDRLEIGGGTGGSNLVAVAGTTARRAALALREDARGTAASMLEASPADLRYDAGTFRIAGTDLCLTFGEIARHLEDLPDAPGCLASAGFEGQHTTFPGGACMVEVEIDPETGGVQVERLIALADIGQVLCDEDAAGQIHGGLGQSVGEALLEAMVLDPDGQPLSGSLMDYVLPRADDMPGFETGWAPTGSPNTPLGAKGVGELSSIGAPGVIVNAVLDALGPLGVRQIDKPLTPGRLWAAIRAAANGAGA